MAIQCERVKKTIAALAAYGALPDGGTTRLSYTPEYLAAQEFLKQEMLAAGMLTEIDPIGNLIGSYVGSSPELPAVMSGSHLDTVPGGGNFDGALGIAAALECVRSWQEEGYRPKRTVQVIATVEEECTAFGMACFGVRVRSGEFKQQRPESITHLADLWPNVCRRLSCRKVRCRMQQLGFRSWRLLWNCISSRVPIWRNVVWPAEW